MKIFGKLLPDRRSRRDAALDWASDIAGSIFYSVGIYTFAKMADFAPGGISGLALILNHLWGLPIGATSLVINLPLILLSYRIVGRHFMLKSIRTIIVSTLFLDFVFPLLPVYQGDQLLASLFSGLFFGLGLAVIYMRGSSTGGTDFLTMSIKALRPHLSIGFVTMAIDLVIILLGWPVFGRIDSVLYGLIAAFVTSTVIDKVMYGTNAGKLAIIITTHGQQVANRIDEVCSRGSTVIRARGSYTEMDRQVLLCACSKAESYKVRLAAHQTDPSAFVMITETSEVFGEGFIEPEENVKL
ncbi:MAG: YitT family protein [Eubacteriales bacterium]|nr:YitT family protein [Eubacteriales bacterium]